MGGGNKKHSPQKKGKTMQFKATVIGHEDSSYDGKKGRVNQETLTVLDADAVKIKDTIDCVFKSGVVQNAQTLVGKTVTFIIDGVRPSNTMRPRFTVVGVAGSPA